MCRAEYVQAECFEDHIMADALALERRVPTEELNSFFFIATAHTLQPQLAATLYSIIILLAI